MNLIVDCRQMSTTITIPSIRQQTDVTLRVTLSDNGVAVSWPDLSSLKAFIYSEAQRIIAGECTWAVDEEDDTILVCNYDALKPQFLGVQKIVIVCEYAGQQSTFDKEAFTFVATTDETSTNGTTVAEETAEVDIDVTDVDSSVLSGAIAAALEAAEAANAAAGHAPYIGQNGNWYIWSADVNNYVDSGTSATGPQGLPGNDGADGVDGGILYPTFSIDGAMHLQMSDAGSDSNQRFSVNDRGHFLMNY